VLATEVVTSLYMRGRYQVVSKLEGYEVVDDPELPLLGFSLTEDLGKCRCSGISASSLGKWAEIECSRSFLPMGTLELRRRVV